MNIHITPYTIVIDTREQHPFSFTGFAADAKQKYRDLLVLTETGTLKTGDYSLKGFETRIAGERKSLSDAYNTFGNNRARWERELKRLAEMEFAFIVTEASWPSILSYEPPPSASGRQFTPKHFYRSVISWQIDYPTIHWWFCSTRRFAERTTLRILEHYWKEQQHG